MKPKYEKGEQVTSLVELIAGMYWGQRYYLNNKVQSLAWLQNMRVRVLHQFVEHGRVWYAVERNKDECENLDWRIGMDQPVGSKD